MGTQTVSNNLKILYNQETTPFRADIRLTFDGASSINPRVVVDQNYGYVVWQDNRDGNWEIYWQKINRSTGAIVVGPIRLTTTGDASREPAIGIDANSNSYVVWEEATGLYGTIYSTKIGSDGTVLMPPIAMSSNLSIHSDISVVPSGENWITYHRMGPSDQDVYLRKSNNSFSELCTVSWNKGTLPGMDKRPTVLATDTYVMVAWRDLLSNPLFQDAVLVRIFNLDCGALDELYVYGEYTNPDIAGFGGTFFVSFELGGNIYNMLGNNSVYQVNDVSGVAYNPRITTDNINGFFVWQDLRNGNQNIYSTYAYSNQSYVDEPVTTDNGTSSTPDIAGFVADPDKSWVVWVDDRDGNSEIYMSTNFEIICCVPPIRGNVDNDELDEINISDLVFLIAYMFQGGAEPPCLDEADIDGSSGIDISDLVGLVGYMFQGGADPALCP